MDNSDIQTKKHFTTITGGEKETFERMAGLVSLRWNSLRSKGKLTLITETAKTTKREIRRRRPKGEEHKGGL